MINAMITGRLIHATEMDNLVVGRIVLEGDRPVQFTARRGIVKAALLELKGGTPVTVSGVLSSRVKYDRDDRAYVFTEILVSAVLTAAPQPTGLFGSILKG